MLVVIFGPVKLCDVAKRVFPEVRFVSLSCENFFCSFIDCICRVKDHSSYCYLPLRHWIQLLAVEASSWIGRG